MSRSFSGKKKVKVTIEGVALTCTFFKKGLGGRPSATCFQKGAGGDSEKAAPKKAKNKKKSSKRRSRSRS